MTFYPSTNSDLVVDEKSVIHPTVLNAGAGHARDSDFAGMARS
jgi:hypothetical protein